MDDKLKIWEVSLLLALCCTLLCALWAERTSETLSDGVVRLHVLADADTPEEQRVKTAVKEAVCAYLAPRMERAEDRRSAESLLRRERENIRRAAEAKAEGRAVRVALGRVHYPSRFAGGYALPAGEYVSLRVILGSGRGHNWWGLLFTQLCVQSIESEREELPAYAVSMDGETAVGFKLLELWDGVRKTLARR